MVDVAWARVDDPSVAGTMSRTAGQLAGRLGFSDHRSGEVAIAAMELCTNLYRHAVAGAMVLRVLRLLEQAAVELVAVDAGPGIDDVYSWLADGHSSRGTLGIGLGAVQRMASSFHAHSVKGRGTVVVATFWPETRSRSAADGRFDGDDGAEVTALTRPINGETVCGDSWAEREADGSRAMVMLADGLGHGPLAAAASQAAVRAFEDATGGPADILQQQHARLSATRGAAVAIADLDIGHGVMRFAGVGNISAWVVDDEGRHGMISHPGIVGHQVRSMREVSFPLAGGVLVILHSDGISNKWDLRSYPGLRNQDVTVVAATIMRDAGIRHDDASIVVARVRSGLAADSENPGGRQ